MEYNIERSKQFKKEYNKLKISGNKVLRKNVDEVIKNLKNKIFQPSMQVHPLKGNKKGLWDVHVSGDYVILYYYDELNNVLHLENLGNHSTTNIESYNDDYTIEEYRLLKELY